MIPTYRECKKQLRLFKKMLKLANKTGYITLMKDIEDYIEQYEHFIKLHQENRKTKRA